MQIEYNVVALILTDNCLRRLEKTFKSLYAQTFPENRLKIVIVDNASTDGTYETLVNYALKSDLSFFRLKRKQHPTTLLSLALSFLEPVDFKYMTIVRPGDVLYEKFIERCADIMDNHDRSERAVLLSEVDLEDQYGSHFSHPPLFFQSCILTKRAHCYYLAAKGLGRKVQSFYRKGAVLSNLEHLPFSIDHTDLFKMAYYLLVHDCIYLKETLSAITITPPKEPIQDLMLRLYQLIRIEASFTRFVSDASTSLENAVSLKPKAEKKLGLLAMDYAIESLKKTDKPMARKLLIFSKMVYKDLQVTPEYKLIADWISGTIPPEPQASLLNLITHNPPNRAILI